MKAFLNRYNRMRDYIYRLVHYMFAAVCLSDNLDHFTKFIGIVATTDYLLQPWTGAMDWSDTPPTRHHGNVATYIYDLWSLCISPSPHSPNSTVAIQSTSVWVLQITTDDVLLCVHIQPKFRTTVPHPKGGRNGLLPGVRCI